MTTTSAAGYSGTPLAKKLGIQENARVVLVGPPEQFIGLLEPLPSHVHFDAALSDHTDIVLVFATSRDQLVKQLAYFRKSMRSNATVWVCWPKKASRMPTDISEDGIRGVALPLGFVDVKVCAISDVWSGLKLVVRRQLR